MGKPIRIYDLAKKMIQLSGLTVHDENNLNGDIKIKYTGLKPGEKLYEELLVKGNYSVTKNKLIIRSEEDMIDWDKLEPMLTKIEAFSTNINKNSDKEKLYHLVKKIVPQFNPKSNVHNQIRV